MHALPIFDDQALAGRLRELSPTELDELPFGVIGFDDQGLVACYNRYESVAASFTPQDVLGKHVFIELAPCFNNFLVAGRFEASQEAGEPLDEQLPYVLTFRMRPTRVRLRLLSEPGTDLRYILVERNAQTAS